MPNGWEELYPGILDPNDANDADVDSDSVTGDGYNNLCEYLHGSNPLDGNSTPDPNFNITIYVPEDVNSIPSDANAIQRAINASIDGDTIVVSEGTYYEAIDFYGIACTVTSTDPCDWDVVENTIIDANDSDAVVVRFDNSEDGNSVLTGFTITGGGWGIYCNNTSPTITNCEIIDNGPKNSGSGMFISNGASPTITNCSFSGNTSTYYGGAICDYNESSPTIVNCIFSDNNAVGGGTYGGYGGAIYNQTGCSPTITNCIFIGNSAYEYNNQRGEGGAIYNCHGSSPDIMNCIFQGNTANQYGGAIHDFNDSSPTIVNCIFRGNNTVDNGILSCGGAIGNKEGCSPTIASCIFSCNNADGCGGAISNKEGCSPTIINCTFNGNSADDDGGGMWSYGISEKPSNSNVTNCIFWDNYAVGSGDEIYNYNIYADPNFRNCDIKNSYIDSGDVKEDGTDRYLGSDDGGNIDSDPNFIDASNPTGPDGIFGTYDDGLQLWVISPLISPCIDAADGNAAPSTDITGLVRVDVDYVDNTGNGDPNYADIGAYESPEIWFVDEDAIAGSNDGSSWEDAFIELRDAINVANNGYEIWVAEGTYKPTSGSDKLLSFEMVEGGGIYGGFAGTEIFRYQRNWAANKTILSGDIVNEGEPNDNSYNVVRGANNAVLDGFMITGGRADSAPPPLNSITDGGGMYNDNVSPTVINCTFSDNSAIYYGGGMLNYSGGPILKNCIFSGNSAFAGGAICNFYSDSTLTNCTFSGNSADSGGGGMYNFESNPVLTNCILWGNDASIIGDEICNEDSDPQFRHCDVNSCGGSDSWDSNFGTDLGGNINSDPCFVDINDPIGLDGVFFSWDDGLRLDANSLCIDAANGDAALLQDILGLDRVDISGVDHNGVGEPNYVDIGAYESYHGYDSDSDGMDDDYEILHDIDDPGGDKDGDGLTNLQEFGFGTRPDNIDTDGDGMDDYWEDDYGLDPLDASDAEDDPDNDDRDNLQEYKDGSNPNEYEDILRRIVYEYDNAGQVTRETIQDTNTDDVAVTEYQYDELGRRWQQRRWATVSDSNNSNDIITLYSYDVRSNVKETVRKGVGGTDPYAIQAEYDLITENSYNSLGRLIDVNDNGLITEYTYYTGGQVYEVNDPNGNTTTNYYDTAGRLEETVDAEGHYRVNCYDSLGRTTKQIAYDSGDNALMQTRFEYDGLGHVICRAVMADADSTSSIDPNTDMIIDYAYDSNDESYPGLLASQTIYYGGDPYKYATTVFEYDGLGRRTKTTDPNGNQTLLTYDDMGRVTQRQQIDVNPLAGESNLVITTGYVYDLPYRAEQHIAKPDVNDSNTWQTTTYYYNVLGNRSQETRPNGVVLIYSYNALGQLTEKIADYGTGKINQETEYSYDRLGRQTSITGYADGSTAQTTIYTYDVYDRIIEVNYPDDNYITFEYNLAGKVVKRTDQRGIVTDYSYDGTYNMLAKYVDGNGETDDANEIFTYDGLGRMLTATKTVDSNLISETAFLYNDIGKIAEANEALFGEQTPKEISYTYDQAGYSTSITYPFLSIPANITPDWQGRIDTVKLYASPIATYEYVGSRVAQRYYLIPDITYQPSYDNLGRITGIHAYKDETDIVKFSYEYDPNTNNISSQIYDHRTNPADPCTDFSYDNLDRLTLAEYGIDDTDEAFTIDDLGNRENVNVRDGNNITYTVDNLTNRYTKIEDANLSYNAAGDLTKDKDSYEYEYDYENRIVKITKDGNDIAEFSYDALGRRIEKKDLVDPNNTIRYYYNYKWQVLAEYDGSDTAQRIFIYGNYIDEVVFIYNFNPNSYYWYVHDHLYSPAALVDSTGTVVERYEYDAYGNPYILDAQYAPRTTSNYGNPFLFTGRRVDILDSGSLKIQYNRNRYYDYYSGRWLTHDPLGITPNVRKPNVFEILKRYEDGLNLYYALDGNPVTKMDMYGLTSCDICGPDVTMNLVAVINRIVNDFQDMNDTSEDPERDRHCDALYDTSTRGGAWEIYQLHGRGWISNQFSCCATKPRCYNTVEVSGKCYHASSVNYLMWGVMNNLCGNSWDLTFLAIYAHKLWKHHHLPTPETIDWARTGYILPTDWPSHLPVSRHRHCETDRCFDFHPGTAVPRFTYRWDALPEPGIDWIDW